MILACYTSEQYLNDTRRLTRWLNSRPWAANHTEDLAAEAMLSALELQRNGRKPRWLTSLAQDAARGRGYRLLSNNTRTRNPRTGAVEKTKTPTRREIEQQIDLATLMLPAPTTSYPDHLQDALELIQRVGSPALQQAVQLMLAGADLAETAAEVGMPETSLRRALRQLGSKLTRQSSQKNKKPKTNPQQMDLFGQPDQEV